MTEAISSTAGLENLAKIYGGGSTRDIDADAFMDAFDHGLNTLAKRPDFQEKMSAIEEMSGTYSGEVGQQKADLLSETSKTEADSAEAAEQSMTDRFQSLYFEMTHYQVAWKIAQNVQRDVSQVLRGS